MGWLLPRQFTTARPLGKSRGPWVWVALALVAAPLGASDLRDGPDDSPGAHRWTTVMPLPRHRDPGTGTWTLNESLAVDWGPATGAERDALAERLDLMLTPLGRGWHPAQGAEPAAIRFRNRGAVGEGYTLTVGPDGADLGASEPVGRYYALVTLTQLLPPRATSQETVRIPGGRYVDAPAFGWRGLMLDSSRHFQTVATLESVLELMALHKLNRFHWHLTDDQGWRLEIPGWPRLTSVGAWRTEVDGRISGGFYTADDVRTLVAFAARRYITIVPEVDVPGHASAALAAYPELSASGAPRSVPLDWGVADGVLSLGKASVHRFTSDVLATLVALFPGPWIHWGGDEVYRTPWMHNPESEAWMRRSNLVTADDSLAEFWNDLARRTLAAGRIPMGWDEVADFNPPAGTVVQWWDTGPRALDALGAGYPLVASWKLGAYLDYPELSGDGDRAPWMSVQPLERVAQDPFWPPGTPESQRSLVLGLEADLWTERAPQERLGRKLFPRLALLAELAWRGVPGGVPGWPSRLEDHRERLEAWGVGMAPPVQ